MLEKLELQLDCLNRFYLMQDPKHSFLKYFLEHSVEHLRQKFANF